jgi:hypothetical protein
MKKHSIPDAVVAVIAPQFVSPFTGRNGTEEPWLALQFVGPGSHVWSTGVKSEKSKLRYRSRSVRGASMIASSSACQFAGSMACDRSLRNLPGPQDSVLTIRPAAAVILRVDP